MRVLVILLCLPVWCWGALHEEVDALVAKGMSGTARQASGEEFLRRVYLDLTGAIPTAKQARAFLDDKDAHKRVRLIDSLLSSPEFSRHMAETFSNVLMERRINPGDAGAAEWMAYLESSFAANKPLDQMTKEILAPDAENESTRATALFYIKRLDSVGANPVDYPRLTRDIGRMFLGKDLQCAQCHNHLQIKEYKQVDFQGLFAFVTPTYIRKDVKFAAIGEKVVDKKTPFQSVFNKDQKETGPKLPGMSEVELPVYKKGEEWVAPPDKKAGFQGKPKFSPTKALAEEVVRSPDFAPNWGNRLWFMLMGRGIVNPLDQHHAANPPSNPQLLELLAVSLSGMNYDVKGFVRELMLTQVYQRSSETADGQANRDEYRIANTRRLSAEQLSRSVLIATGNPDEVMAMSAKEKNNPASKPKKGEKVDGPLTIAEVQRRFIAAFANPVGEAEIEFAPSLAGALFLSNSQMLLDWLKPHGENLAARLVKIEDPAALADELYLSVLTRRPTAEESADVAAYLKAHADRREQAIADLAWSLLSSTEFCINH